MAAAGAQTGEAPAATGPTGENQTQHDASSPAKQPQGLLEEAILTLESRHSISARIRHRIELFGNQLVGSGIYLEERSGPYPLLRQELKIQLTDHVSTLLQVCDGRYLWTYRELLGERTLSQIDAVRVARAMERAGRMPQPGNIDGWPGLGGLPRLLRGLHRAFHFARVEQTRLRQLPTWRFVGQWKADQLASILPKQKDAIEKGQPADLSRLPEHLPDHVILWLGKEDLFPYRIEYCRRVERSRAEGQVESRVLVAMELFEVNLNLPINPARFVYNPGDMKISDRTDAFLERLNLKDE